MPGEVTLPITVLPLRRHAVIAGRRDDDEAGLDRALDRLANRVVLVALRRRRAQRQVHDADAELLAEPDREVDRLDDVGRFALAVRIEHLQVDQVRGRRHAGIGAVDCVLETARRDDAGDVRAVPVEVAGPGRGDL